MIDIRRTTRDEINKGESSMDSKPLRTIRHSRQNSLISSSEDAKSRAQRGVDESGAMFKELLKTQVKKSEAYKIKNLRKYGNKTS